jgi:NADH-quinone oxidoreductase subunit J
LTLSALLFIVLAAVTAVSALAVVLTTNIVRAAVWLLFTLAGTAALYFLLGAGFVGASQLIVYVGGTLVLVVFGVMLTAQGQFLRLRTRAGEWALAGAVGLLLCAALVGTVLREAWPAAEKPADPTPTARLGTALLGLTEATAQRPLTGLPVGEVSPPRKRMGYLLPFEVVSVHLLVVLIGAAYLARAKRRPTAPEPPPADEELPA